MNSKENNKGTINNKNNSLKRRYIFKLFANMIGLVGGFVTQMIVPRALSPGNYGDYNFLTNFFTQVANFFEMGTSIGFYTKLSKRPDDKQLVTYYSYFTGFISLLIFALVGLSQFTMYEKIWPGQKLLYIYLAAICGILIWISQVVSKITDAYGLTVLAETAKVIQKLIGVGILFVIFFLKFLNLTNYFFYQIFTLALLSITFIWITQKNICFKKAHWRLNVYQIKSYTQEFYIYSHPLFIYGLVSMLIGIFDRWILQIYGGSVQQGFFGLSYQLGAICFVFTSAISPLFMREFSIAFENKNLLDMARFFRKYIPLMYFITAYLACYVAVQASKVVYIFGGQKYKEAAFVFGIMAFYPIHQTYGQLSGSVFYATEETKLYRNIGISFMLIGLPLTYFLIAPENKMGLNTGAVGLALKMVIIQFFAVNTQLYYNAKMLRLSFWKYLAHQLLSVLCLLSIAVIVTFIGDGIFSGNVYICFLVEGLIYTVMTFILIYFLPQIAGLKKNEIKLFITSVISRLKLDNKNN